MGLAGNQAVLDVREPHCAYAEDRSGPAKRRFAATDPKALRHDTRAPLVVVAALLASSCHSLELPTAPAPDSYVRELTPQDLTVLRAVLQTLPRLSAVFSAGIDRKSYIAAVRTHRYGRVVRDSIRHGAAWCDVWSFAFRPRHVWPKPLLDGDSAAARDRDSGCLA